MGTTRIELVLLGLEPSGLTLSYAPVLMGVEGFEPSPLPLQGSVLPLHQTPMLPAGFEPTSPTRKIGMLSRITPKELSG